MRKTMSLKLPSRTEVIVRRLLEGVEKVGDYRRIGEHGHTFEPISIEMIGPTVISVAQSYIEQGDIMWDPMVELFLGEDGISPLTFEMSMPPTYQRAAEVRNGQLLILNDLWYRNLVVFLVEWFGNLEHQHDF